MAKTLTKFVYGNEVSRKKTPFGLLNNQIISDSIIKNAGWFNLYGEKLGAGDLSIKEMANIAKSIPSDEMFVVLSEADSEWLIPTQFDKSEPGTCYAIDHATWLIGRKMGIVRVRDDIARGEKTSMNGVAYTRMPHSVVLRSFFNRKVK